MPERTRRQIGFRPTDALRDRLTAAADAFGVTANFLMERLLNEALDDLIPASEFRLTRRPRREPMPVGIYDGNPDAEMLRLRDAAYEAGSNDIAAAIATVVAHGDAVIIDPEQRAGLEPGVYVADTSSDGYYLRPAVSR